MSSTVGVGSSAIEPDLTPGYAPAAVRHRLPPDVLLVVTVVTFNRVVWARLYRYVQHRYVLEG